MMMMMMMIMMTVTMMMVMMTVMTMMMMMMTMMMMMMTMMMPGQQQPYHSLHRIDRFLSSNNFSTTCAILMYVSWANSEIQFTQPMSIMNTWARSYSSCINYVSLYHGVSYISQLIVIYHLILWSHNTCHMHVHLSYADISLRARFIGPTRGPSGADRTQVGPMWAPWTLLSGKSSEYGANIHCLMQYHSDVTWMLPYLKSLMTRLFIQQLVQAHNKEDINVLAFGEGNTLVTNGFPSQGGTIVLWLHENFNAIH